MNYNSKTRTDYILDHIVEWLPLYALLFLETLLLIILSAAICNIKCQTQHRIDSIDICLSNRHLTKQECIALISSIDSE